MVSLKTIASAAAVLATAASALPASIRLNSRQLDIYGLARRQNEMAKGMNLTDVDILQFALGLEHLETDFYTQALEKLKGKMSPKTQEFLENTLRSESTHVTSLTSAIAQAKAKPVQACKYKFDITDEASTMATAAQLENVGMSAYLGAAGAISDKNILGTAASILTVEARHQTAVRDVQGQQAVVNAFDTPLTPKAVVTIANNFVESCPEGSNLPGQPFPGLTMMAGQAAGAMTAGATVKLAAASGGSGATNCAFTTSPDKSATGVDFQPFSEAEGCKVPPNLGGISYVFLTKERPVDDKLTDDIVTAGPMIMAVS